MEENKFRRCRFLRWEGFNLDGFRDELKSEMKLESLVLTPNEDDIMMIDLELSIPPELKHTLENILKKYTKIYTWINE